ncbi:MAG: hypothetical protein GY821_06410 [Gammaproteobacteria bacterium]|nr:hypothetical protein [Gammaproteobacteria bacterium]
MEKGVAVENISRGMNLMRLQVNNVLVLDSLNFVPMALAKMPKAFDLGGVKKGYFPHFFNKSTTPWDYKGPFPPLEDYGANSMKPAERQKLVEWHAQQQDKEFVFAQEIHDYCQADVDLLRCATWKFRMIFKEMTGVDCFAVGTTIASVCMHVYRKLFLKHDQIALVPYKGYRRKEQQSIIAVKWLKWIVHKEGHEIRHALNGGEIRVGNHKLDGYAEIDGVKTAFEFQVCAFL